MPPFGRAFERALIVVMHVLHVHFWSGFSTYVVEDTADLLAVYPAKGSTLAFSEWLFDRWQHPVVHSFFLR